jgi:multicomponent K+:H+ antiporter subunit E
MTPAGAWPHPLLSLLLAAAWLLLQQSLALPNLLTAALLGWGLPRLLHGFLGRSARIHAWGPAMRLVALVLWDIVIANGKVAWLVLWPGARPQPAWVPVPLALRHPTAVSLFATIITTTPGTVSCDIDTDAGLILVHALDCSDPAAAAAEMKQRYERPLQEIFEP